MTSSSDGKWSLREGDSEQASLRVRVAPSGEAASGKGEGSKGTTYTLALLGQRFGDNGQLEELREQPLVGNPRLAAAYTYGYNQPLLAHRARQLAATLKWLMEKHPHATLTVEGQGAGAALAAAGAVALQEDAQVRTEARKSVRLRLRPQGFRFAKIDSIRDPNFIPASARYWDLPGLVSCFTGTCEIADEDSADFAKLQGLSAAAK